MANHIHWAAPVTIVVALLTGVGLAIAHHLLYAALNGMIVSPNTLSVLGSSISRQELNIAVGTAIAYLANASLGFSVAISFTQLFWAEVKSRSPTRPTALATLDDLYSALGYLPTLRNPPLWSAYPLLLVTAAVAWLIPIASTVTPATLSVQLTATASSFLHRVPNLDFSSLSFVGPMQGSSDPLPNPTVTSYVYSNPSQVVLQITNAVFAEGTRLFIQSPIHAANASWKIDFLGPALKCHYVDPTEHFQIRQNVYDFMKQGNSSSPSLYGYLAWSPFNDWNATLPGNVPFSSAPGDPQLRFRPIAPLSGPSTIYSNNPEVLFYMLAMPSVFGVSNHDNAGALIDPEPAIPPWINGNMLQCQAYEGHYFLTFDNAKGFGTVSIDKVTLDASSSIKAISQVFGPNLLQGIDGCQQSDTSNASTQATESCYTNPNILRRLAYSAVMDAFGRSILGSIYVDPVGDIKADSPILNTALMDTNELSFIRDAQSQKQLYRYHTLQHALLHSNDTAAKGILNTKEPKFSPSLQLPQAVEQMFQNITVSLMSSPALQPNYSSTTAPPPANVTVKAYENTYIYAAWRLWVPYGIAILLTSLATLAGLVTIFANNASYSNSFSTVIRVSKAAAISADIEKIEDLDGRDPLPDYLARATISFGKHANS